MTERAWVLKETVLAVHRRQLAEHGGPSGVRDEGLLDSALARPRNLVAYSDVTPSLAQLAAAYAYGLARNHPFIDGNKRTAYVVSLLFLRLNGAVLVADSAEKFHTFQSLAAGALDEAELARWIDAHLHLV